MDPYMRSQGVQLLLLNLFKATKPTANEISAYITGFIILHVCLRQSLRVSQKKVIIIV